LEVQEKIAIPSECVAAGRLIRTNFERLFLMAGELADGITFIDSDTLDLELETRVTDFYLSYWTLTIQRESEAKWQSEICNVATGQLMEDQVIFHGEHVMKLQGELMLEFPCTKVIVRTRSEFKSEGDSCLDHLPVFLPDNTMWYLTPIHRLLVPRSSVNVVNCSSHYPIVFEDREGNLITANPGVTVIDVQLSDFHHLDAKSENHSEMFAFSSLLYTKEEVSAYEEMLRGHSAEQAVTRKFTSFYCETTGGCSPSRLSKDFKWNQMINPDEVLDHYVEKIKNVIITWGVTWGVIDSVLTMLQIFVKMVIVCKNIGKKRLTGRSIFKFVFLPGHELINLFPRISEDAGVSYRAHDEGILMPGSPEGTELISISRAEQADMSE
jgi:hypothetical protein